MGADLIYLDEQEGSTERGKYTAVLAAIIPSENIHAFRTDYYSVVIGLLSLSPKEDGVRRLDSVPLLHGSSLLRDRTDTEKVQVVDLLLDCFVRHGGTFARLG